MRKFLLVITIFLPSLCIAQTLNGFTCSDSKDTPMCDKGCWSNNTKYKFTKNEIEKTLLIQKYINGKIQSTKAVKNCSFFNNKNWICENSYTDQWLRFTEKNIMNDGVYHEVDIVFNSTSGKQKNDTFQCAK
jgi:hypothetical protein